MIPEPRTLVDLLRRRAETTPSTRACWTRDRQGAWRPLTWGEVLVRVEDRAAALCAAGLRLGEAVGIVGPPCRSWWEAEFATLLAGGVVVGLDPYGQQEQLLDVVERTGITRLIVAAAPGSSVAERVANIPVDKVDFESAGRVAASQRSFPVVHHDDAAAVYLTSGTTGRPKAIRHSHAQLLAGCLAIARRYEGLGNRDRLVAWLPMSALFQRSINHAAVAVGAQLWFVEDPQTIVERLREIRPTILVGVPRFFEKVHRGIESHIEELLGWQRPWVEAALNDTGSRSIAARLRSRIARTLVLPRLRRVLGGAVRFMVTGSAATPRPTLEFFHHIGIPLFEAYGVTENTVPIAMSAPNAVRLGSVGRPSPENEVRVADDGEVLVRGPGLFNGYLGERAGDGRHFAADGFYRTGDLGEVDEDGFLHLRGRKDDLFKTSTGRRISPVAAESVYGRSPLIESLMVVGEGRPFPAALVVPNLVHLRRNLAGLDLRAVPDGELVELPMARDRFAEEFDRLGRELPEHLRVCRFALLRRPFTLATGELTTTLKLRRRFVATSRAALLDELYAGVDAVVVESRTERMLEVVR